MFLQASVCPQGGGGVCLSAWWDTTPLEQTLLEQTPPCEQTPPQEQTSPWEQTPPRNRHPPGADIPLEQTPPLSRHLPQSRHPPGSRHPLRDGHYCGRYASYWNAFFLLRAVTPNRKLVYQVNKDPPGPELRPVQPCSLGDPPFFPRPVGKRTVGFRLRGILIFYVFADRRRIWTRSAQKLTRQRNSRWDPESSETVTYL